MSNTQFSTEKAFEGVVEIGAAQTNATIKRRGVDGGRISAICQFRRVQTRFGKVAIGRHFLPDDRAPRTGNIGQATIVDSCAR